MSFRRHSYSISCLYLKSKILVINVQDFSPIPTSREQKQNSTSQTIMVDNSSRVILKQITNNLWLCSNTLMACVNMLAKYPLCVFWELYTLYSSKVAYNTMIFCCLVRQANDSPTNNYSIKGNDTTNEISLSPLQHIFPP